MPELIFSSQCVFQLCELCDINEIHLRMFDTELPEKTLTADWYGGHNPLIYLAMRRMEILVIEANAFSSPAFADLYQLNIENLLHIIDYHMDMFIGLEK